MSLGGGAWGSRGVELGVEVGRVVGLGEGEIDGEAGGLVGLDRAAALQRFGRDRRFELGGEGRVIAAGYRRGREAGGLPVGVGEVGDAECRAGRRRAGRCRSRCARSALLLSSRPGWRGRGDIRWLPEPYWEGVPKKVALNVVMSTSAEMFGVPTVKTVGFGARLREDRDHRRRVESSLNPNWAG